MTRDFDHALGHLSLVVALSKFGKCAQGLPLAEQVLLVDQKDSYITLEMISVFLNFSYPCVTRILLSLSSNTQVRFRLPQFEHGCCPEHLIFCLRHREQLFLKY